MSLKVESSKLSPAVSSAPTGTELQESIGARVSARHGRRVRGIVDGILPATYETKCVKPKKVSKCTCVHVKETLKEAGEGVSVDLPKATPCPPLETKREVASLPLPSSSRTPLLVRTQRMTASILPSLEKEVSPPPCPPGGSTSVAFRVGFPVVAAEHPLLGVEVPQKQKCLGLAPNLVAGELIGVKDSSGIFRFVQYVRPDELDHDWIICKGTQGEKRVRRFGCISVKNSSDPLPQQPLGEEVPAQNLSARSVGNDVHVHDVLAVQSISDSGGIFRFVQYLGKTGRSIPSVCNPTKMEETIWYTETDERMRFELPAHMFRMLKTPVMLKQAVVSPATNIQRVHYRDRVPQTSLAMSLRRLDPQDVVAFHEENDPEDVYRYVRYLGPSSQIQGGFIFYDGSKKREASRAEFRSINTSVVIPDLLKSPGLMCDPMATHIEPSLKTLATPAENQRKIEGLKQPASWIQPFVGPEGELQALRELDRKKLSPFDVTKFGSLFPTLRNPAYALGVQVLNSVQNIYDFALHVYAANLKLFQTGVSFPSGPLNLIQENFWEMLRDIYKENS